MVFNPLPLPCALRGCFNQGARSIRVRPSGAKGKSPVLRWAWAGALVSGARSDSDVQRGWVTILFLVLGRTLGQLDLSLCWLEPSYHLQVQGQLLTHHPGQLRFRKGRVVLLDWDYQRLLFLIPLSLVGGFVGSGFSSCHFPIGPSISPAPDSGPGG